MLHSIVVREKLRILLLFFFLAFLPSVLADPTGWLNDILIVDNGRLATLQEPKMEIDKEGNIHVVWWDRRDGAGEIYYKKLDNQGKNLTDDTRVSFGLRAASEGHSLAIDDDGNIHIVWDDGREGNDEIYYKKLDNNGNSRSVETRLTFDFATSLRPKITVNHGQNADVHIIWTDNRDGNFAPYYTRLDNNGRTLTDDMRITNSFQYAHADSIDIDSLNNVHVFWSADRRYPDGGRDEVYYKKLNHVGSPLTPEIRITFDPMSTSVQNAFVDEQDNIHLAMTKQNFDNFPTRYIYYKRLDSNGMNLTADIQITDNASNIMYPANPDIIADSCGNVHLVWQQDIAFNTGNYEIFYTKLYPSGNRMMPNLRLTTAPRGSESPSLGIDADDGLHLVWQDDRHGHSSEWEVWYKRSIPTMLDAYSEFSVVCPVEVYLRRP